jgi:hypothetical protein
MKNKELVSDTRMMLIHIINSSCYKSTNKRTLLTIHMVQMNGKIRKNRKTT